MRRVESYVLGIPFVSLKEMKIDFEILTLDPGAGGTNPQYYRL
jgi:hypothetical protein